MPDPRITSIVDRSGHAETVAWAHEGHGNVASLPDPELAIAAALVLGNGVALASVTAPKPLRKLASAALHKLKSQGVKVAAAAPPRSFSLGAEEVNVPPRAFLSRPNTMGNIHLVLTATDRDGSCIMELIYGGSRLNDNHGHASRGELRSFWRELENDRAMGEIPFVAGLHLGDVLVQGKHAHGWDHLLEKVDPGTLTSARLLDPLRHAPPAKDDDGDPGDWTLPAWLVPPKVVESTLESMPQELAPEGEALPEAWLEAGTDEALSAARHEFATACEQFALAFALLGRPRAAAEARSVRRRIEDGEAGRTLPQVRQSLLLAVYDEIRRRDEEQRADMDGIMRMVGKQGG